MHSKTAEASPELQDLNAQRALDARRRIERAVENGRLPAWVMDACEAWERAALAYGAAMARRDLGSDGTRMEAHLGSCTLH
jgi:hypothetical protein